MNLIDVRVTLKYVDDQDNEPFMFDIKIDKDINIIVGKWIIFGVCGDPSRSDECYPVMLRRDGAIEFGAYALGVSEKYTTNLRRKEIIRGEYVTIAVDQEEYTYRIESVSCLE